MIYTLINQIKYQKGKILNGWISDRSNRCLNQQNYLELLLIYYLSSIQQRMSKFYEDLCNLFIRPARQTYSNHDLGPHIIKSLGVRKDFTITSLKQFNLKCSYFKNQNAANDVAVVYLHSFNGSRLQSLKFVEPLLERGFDFCSFDFAGSGNSSGDYVSLGHNEKHDIMRLLMHIRDVFGVSKFCLWGRSMGAVSAIKFKDLLVKQKLKHSQFSNIDIFSMILDSPFVSLSQLSIQIAQKKISIPQILIKAVFLMIKSTIESKADFKVDELELTHDIDSLDCPILILASKNDTLIHFHHSEDIYKQITHQNKELHFIKGQHCQNRDKNTNQTIYNFIVGSKNKMESMIDKNDSTIRKYAQLKDSGIFRYSTISKNGDFSQDKKSKSLRRYQTKKELPQVQEKSGLNVKQILCNNVVQHKISLSKKLCVSPVSSQNIEKQQISSPAHQESFIEKYSKQYQSEKRTSKASNTKITLTATANKNEIIHTRKPNFCSKKTIELCNQDKTEEFEQGQSKLIRKLDFSALQKKPNNVLIENFGQNHLNIITDKLKKKSKGDRPKHINLIRPCPIQSDISENGNASLTLIQPDSQKFINRQPFESNDNCTGTPAYHSVRQIKITESQATTQTNINQINQIKNIHGLNIISLTPKNKSIQINPLGRRKQEKIYQTDQRVKHTQTSLLRESQNIQSMKNLADSMSKANEFKPIAARITKINDFLAINSVSIAK